MSLGVRAVGLRKIFSTPPPAGARIGTAQVKGASRQRLEVAALDGLSLEVLPGEIFGLLGPNGAGKSTTVEVLTTRVRPTSGQAWIRDHHVCQEHAAVQHLIGVVPQRPDLDFYLTACEVLTFHPAYYG